MKTRKQAEQVGKRILDQLGKGWKIRVWENLGWHVAWHNGALVISYDEEGPNHFFAMVGRVGSGAGHMDLIPRNSPHYRTARLAGLHACRFAAMTIDLEWQPIIDSVEKLLCSFEGL